MNILILHIKKFLTYFLYLESVTKILIEPAETKNEVVKHYKQFKIRASSTQRV